MKSKRLLVSLLALIIGLCGGLTIVSCGESNENSETESSSDSVQYTVTVPKDIAGGYVTVNKITVNSGETVTVTVRTEQGYVLDLLTVNGIAQTLNADGQLILENVTEDIAIFATFALEEKEGIVFVKSSDAPTIDAKIEKIWETVPAFYAKNVHKDNSNDTFVEDPAYLKVMWSEEGMYFLGHVYDSNVVSLDRFNIWFSEVYTDKEGEYSSDAKDGNYAICINPRGENLLYTNMDVSQYWTAAARETQEGYIVEIFVPRLGEVPLSADNLIGLDLSVDYYSLDYYEVNDGTPKRDFYTNWWGEGHYWSNVGALKPMQLLP